MRRLIRLRMARVGRLTDPDDGSVLEHLSPVVMAANVGSRGKPDTPG
jgi:hypothetical protein